MLVIRRRAGQSILIGDGIKVRVIECGPRHVKLGIVAPREVPVVRHEAQATRRQNLAAAKAIPAAGLSGMLPWSRSNLP